MDNLYHQGYQACLNGQPNICPVNNDMARTAWETGWQEGIKELEKQALYAKAQDLYDHDINPE